MKKLNFIKLRALLSINTLENLYLEHMSQLELECLKEELMF